MNFEYEERSNSPFGGENTSPKHEWWWPKSNMAGYWGWKLWSIWA